MGGNSKRLKSELNEARPKGESRYKWAQGDAMGKRKKFTQWIKFEPKADRPKDEQAQDRMAEALAAYRGPITKCSPKSAQARKLSASAQVSKRWSRPV